MKTEIAKEKKLLLQNRLQDLKETFDENQKQYTNNDYDEANTRVDFIDKFFELLEWDVRNDSGYAEQYREVVREDKVRIQGVQKAPDYSFRIGGTRKFFVEAKKPSVNVKSATEPAFQVRRYGYSAKLPLSILTNFEEFAVYDTRIKPSKTDDASVARIFYCTYDEYINKFDFLYNTFSRTAILKGRLDAFVEESKNKKGTSEVDKELLKTLESWREELAKNIALNNPKISLHELNLAVQKIVDRIIFLRIAEDKSMEAYGTLLQICGHLRRYEASSNSKSVAPSMQKSSIYKALINLFDQANTKYNSGLFATLPFLDELIIEDKVFINIIEGLYYPDCPYEFSILPVEILGSIYEQFLGKTIRFRGVKGERHTAIIEEKPEVKKAGGVYYTPEYIVKYIVERTVGASIKGKSPEAIAKMKIIDPSCGSGSFLVGAYSYLLAWHLDYYTQNKHLKKALKEGAIYQASGGAYKLTIEKKQSILLNNIFGLDIDEQAVEVSKLSLYLKLLEDEGREALSKEELFKHSDLKLLPSLMGNIKCGNALVESDYYLGKEASLFEDLEAMREINTFDWEKEFASIFEAGGFDCVIGNPPYVSAPTQIESSKLKLQREYLANCGKYKSLYQKWDLYIPFIEKSLTILKDGGIYSSIIPYPFTNQTYAFSLRNMILQNYNLIEVVDLKGTKVFEHATVTNCIPIIKKEKDTGMLDISHIDDEYNIHISFEKSLNELVIDDKTGGWNLEKENKDASRHNDLHVLGDFCYISYGLRPNADEKTAKGKFKKDDLISNIQDEIHCRKYIEAKDISRYSINRIRYLEYGTKRSPSKLVRPTFNEWYEIHKIFVNVLGNITATFDSCNKFIHNHSLIGLALWKDLKGVENKSISASIKRYSHHTREEMEEISEKVNLHYLLAILNSKYASHLLSIQRGGDYHIYPEHIRNLPIPIAPPSEMQALSDYAKQELALHAKLKEANTPQDKLLIENAIKALDAQIDILVYKIYGLSEKEILHLHKT
ncbi:MAG: Eco57I restriction-modification methylase domain-containing protein [Treponema sp.]